MDLPLLFYIASASAIILTGISKSGFAGGLGVLAVPLMSIFVAPQFAAAVLMPILIGMDIMVVTRLNKRWNTRIIKTLLPGAVVGLIIGAFTFQHLNANAVKFMIGLLALFFVGQFILRQIRPKIGRKTSKLMVFFLSILSGFSGIVGHAGGPPVKGYILQQNLGKTEFVATNTSFFFILNILKFIAYASMGAMSFESFKVSLILAPTLVIGVVLGARLHSMINQDLFIKTVYGFLALAGISLLLTSMPDLFFT